MKALLPDADPLVGDLLEEFESHRSFTRMWASVLLITATTLRTRSDEIRPLALVELQPTEAVARWRALSQRTSPVNLTASPLHGAGGVTVILLALLVTKTAPQIWALLLASIVSGAGFGLLLIRRRRRKAGDPLRVFGGMIPRHVVKTTAVLVTVAATTAMAQPAIPRPSFEVTSVKASIPGERGGALQRGRFMQQAVTLRDLVRMAFGRSEVLGGPGWVDTDRFDVEGRGAFDLNAYLAGADGEPPAVYLMLQRLLEDRFSLRVHPEQRERPVYILTTARGDQQPGPTLRRSTVDCNAQLAATVRGERPPAAVGTMPHCAIGGGPGHLVADAIDLAQLAGALSSFTDRIVLDRTGVAGRFDVDLQWTTELVATSATTAPNTLPTLVTSLREQLGLKIEPATAPVDVIVIDSVTRPTPN